ncbi:MAG: peptidase T [Oscillospiraceae bacterium]|nr:peptidase T [Oscillospiraceae bacterium]
MRAYERFLKYIKIHTSSDPESEGCPSAPREFDLARELVRELREMGVEDARFDDNCYVYGSIPATPGYENAVKLGFISHMDTSPEFSGENVNPVIIANYTGGEVELGSGRLLSPDKFPHLERLKGRSLIVTDGRTLLGADDKAGIAEIMTMAERVLCSETPHGKICIAFTPDEEIGRGTVEFDISGFGADFAYTVDGDDENTIQYENFNACQAAFEIRGFNVHTGSAKNIMINASLVAMEINSMLPPGQTPRDTEGYEGFYHLCGVEGNVEKAEAVYIVRDHDPELFRKRIEALEHIEKSINDKYGAGTVTLTVTQQYKNMAEYIKPCFHLVDNARKAIRDCGMEPVTEPIRGGTDGANLTCEGLPCPNLGVGGFAFHGPYEHITIEGMDNVTNTLCRLVEIYAGWNREEN